MKIAYIMSRFPNLTETFVTYEIVALERLGARVEVFPLLRTRQPVVHPEASEIAHRAHYHPFLSLPILSAHLHFLRRRPRAWLRALFEILHGTLGSANFLAGALAIFPKAVRFAYEIEAAGVTHVHAHFANHPAVAALVVHRLTGIPFSFTAHGHDIHVDRRMLARKIQAASFVVAISEYNRRLMMEECPSLPPGRIHVLHCGADTQRFAPRRDLRADGPFSIVCIGSFIEVKGHRYLVEACRLLKERGHSFRCHLIGEGPERRRVERWIDEARLRDDFIVHGALARPRVVELLSAADVVVQPSVPTGRGSREGIPVSLMEGMACGLPVVASRISGVPELVEDGRTGFLVPPRDPAALARALERLILDPDLRCRMGEAGGVRVREDFDLDRNVAKLFALFSGNGVPDRRGRRPERATRGAPR